MKIQLSTIYWKFFLKFLSVGICKLEKNVIREKDIFGFIDSFYK